MCKIVFLSGNFNDDLKNTATNLCLSALRTETDGWGILTDKTSYKNIEPSEELALKKIEAVFKQNPSFFLFHARNATAGAINEQNTHPVIIDNLAVIHNGAFDGLLNYTPTKNYFSRLTGVSDTFRFTQSLASRLKFLKPKKAILRTLEKRGNWYSVFVYLKDKKRLFYARERAKFLIFKTTNGALIGATDTDKLKEQLQQQKNGLVLFKIDKTPLAGVIEPTESTLYEIKGASIQPAGEVKREDKEEDEEYFWGQKLNF